MLVVATSGTGFVLGSGGVIDFAGLCCTCAGTMMVASSANSLNQVQCLYCIVKSLDHETSYPIIYLFFNVRIEFFFFLNKFDLIYS